MSNILIYIKYSQTHHPAKEIKTLLKLPFPPPLHHGNAPKETTSLIWVVIDPIYFFMENQTCFLTPSPAWYSVIHAVNGSVPLFFG